MYQKARGGPRVLARIWIRSNELNSRTIRRVQHDLLHTDLLSFQVTRGRIKMQARSRNSEDGRQRQDRPQVGLARGPQNLAPGVNIW